MNIEQYFPRKPYPIQLQIANTITKALEGNSTKVVIIESPTGTGKTYSLLCPILMWLTNNQLTLNTPEPPVNDKVPIWLKRVSQQKGEKLLRGKEKIMQQMITFSEARKQLDQRRKTFIEEGKLKPKKDEAGKEEDIEIDSEEEGGQPGKGKKRLDRQTQLIERQLQIEDRTILPKLIFVSRTHSQLSQVIDSLKLIPGSHNLNFLQLSSKQQLCINPSINKHSSSINQQCQHLMDHSHCPHFHQLPIKQFYNKNLSEISQLGTTNQLCPYYGTRSILEYADIVCLPYSSILSSDIRGKLGINLHNSIIVFDQGHNVLDYEKQMHSPEVRVEELEAFASQVDEYLMRFRERLKVGNQKLLGHLLDVLRAFAVVCSGEIQTEQSKHPHRYMSLKYMDFFLKLNLKELNIHRIMKYFQLNNMDKKLTYFNAKDQLNKKGKEYRPGILSTASINRILSFLMEFANFMESSQIIILKWGEVKKGVLKIMCLESKELTNIIEKSRLTILAGGTMQPMDELVSLTQRWKDQMVIEKYPHIITEDQCKIYLIKRMNSQEIFFNHQSLSREDAVAHFRPICTRLLQTVIKRTEKGGGIVIFIQNYQLLSFFQKVFKDQPYERQILYDNREKKENQQQTQDVFSKYTKLVQTDAEKNAILVTVMGGKLSEGINFSDRLARSLVVFGLPYSNMYGPEIMETMAYIDRKKLTNYTGRCHYQNLCLKTLNQTIGRGVRHIKDYVDIYLIDSRFEGIKQKLSSWMRPRIQVVKDGFSL